MGLPHRSLPLLLALCLGMVTATTAHGQRHFPAEDDLAVMLHYLVEDGATPGIALGILDPDGSARILTAGRAGPASAPITGHSVFELGSITKTFTAIVLADMVAQGGVSLGDPVARYLPEGVRVPSRNGREITLVDLATHRSGLPSLPDDFFPPADLADPYGGYGIERLYAFLSGHELGREPGAEAAYSNVGYGLLGHALGRAAGVPFRDLVRERVLEPLGMEDTAWPGEPVAADRLVRGHRHGREVAHWTTTEAFDGAGGLRSTAADMLKYLEANIGSPVTPLQRAMREAHRVRGPLRGDDQIGLGWMMEDHRGRTLLRHGGNSAGFSAMIAFDPDLGTGFVRLTNTGRFPDNIGLHFLRAGAPPAVQEAVVAPGTLARFVGSYELSPETHFHIRLEEDGTLTAQGGPNTVRFRMYATSDSTFVVKRVAARLAFSVNDAGAVEAMTLGARRLPRVADDPPPPGLPSAGILDLPLTPGDIARYEGTYILRLGGGTVEARIEGGAGSLVATVRGSAPTRLLFQGDHEFVLDADPDGRVTFIVANDRATALRLRLAGGVITGQRSP